jgi:hypothetical protein
MNTPTTHDDEGALRHLIARGPQRSIGTKIVACLYVLLLVCSPFLVRYAPDPDRSILAAAHATADIDAPRCATAPEFARSCELAGQVR